MPQLECSNCHLPLAEDDGFCGNCGARAPVLSHDGAVRPDGGTWPEGGAPTRVASDDSAGRLDGGTWPRSGGDERTRARHASTTQPDRFFDHAASRPDNPLTNATRYLCAAAYLNPSFANDVIWELLASRRAVAPSIGMDLGPVIRHCLNSRRIQLARDVILTILLVAGLILATAPAILVLTASFVLSFLPGGVKRRSLAAKLLTGAIFGIVVAVVVGIIGAIVMFSFLTHSSLPVGLLGSGTGKTVALALIFALLSGTAVFVYTYTRYQILREKLRPGVGPFHFDASTPEVEARIAEVEAAQWGNLVLYAEQNPFIGMGKSIRTWSIAIELDRASPAGRDWVHPKARGYAPIDSVELHAEIRRRLLKLKDPELPPNEQISALVVEDHIVGEGQRRWDGPLMDPARNVPYSQASEEAIEALIRHPQAGLRYYQRVSVNDEGQAVFSDSRQVLSGTDQEISVSAFVYAAVEGRMFYLEFVSTALPPVQHQYHVINLLTRMSRGKYLTLVTMDAARSFFSFMLGSPFRLIQTLLLIRRERKAAEEDFASLTDYLQDNVGARLSVREHGSSNSMHTYIQDLDWAKYTKIIERLLTDTVLDFLVSKNVDVSAYRASVSVAINNGTVISDSTVTATNLVGGQAASVQVNQQSGSAAAAAE